MSATVMEVKACVKMRAIKEDIQYLKLQILKNT